MKALGLGVVDLGFGLQGFGLGFHVLGRLVVKVWSRGHTFCRGAGGGGVGGELKMQDGEMCAFRPRAVECVQCWAKQKLGTWESTSFAKSRTRISIILI